LAKLFFSRNSKEKSCQDKKITGENYRFKVGSEVASYQKDNLLMENVNTTFMSQVNIYTELKHRHFKH